MTQTKLIKCETCRKSTSEDKPICKVCIDKNIRDNLKILGVKTKWVKNNGEKRNKL